MKEVEQIFLIDDDHLYLTLTERMINSEFPEIKIHKFEDGEQAATYFQEKQQIDVLSSFIMLDLNMPFLDGWGFLNSRDSFYDDYGRIPVAIVTSSIDSDDTERALLYTELIGYFVKPLYQKEIKEMIQRLVN